MTAGQLIKFLKKFPASTKIAYCAHDQSGEIEGADLCWGGDISRADESTDAVKDRGYGITLHG